MFKMHITEHITSLVSLLPLASPYNQSNLPNFCMHGETHSWIVDGVGKGCKRKELLSSIEASLGEATFCLSYADNKPRAVLITDSADAVQISHRGKPLRVRKKTFKIERVRDVVTPLSGMTYEEQLRTKSEPAQALAHALGCSNVEIIGSPVQTGYRNKCEFTFGYTETGQPVLGFRPSKYTEAPNLVATPEECTYNVSKNMLDAVCAINGYIADKPELIYNRLSKKGSLKILMIRKIGAQVLGVLQLNAETEEGPQKDALERFTAFIAENTCLSVLYVEKTSSVFEGFKPDSKIARVSGDSAEHTETVAGCTFKVSPLAFFQVNLQVAEILASIIQKNAVSNLILDVCCGSGFLGICAARGTDKRVVGMEISQGSVQNARENAALNGTDAEYICDSVENSLMKVVARKTDEKCAALLDPPRAGVSDKLIRKIAASENVAEVFYVSCSYRSVKSNLEELGKRYSLQKVYILDMFPYTREVECVFHYVLPKQNAENVGAASSS